MRQPAPALWSGSAFNNPLKICTVATTLGTQASVKVSCGGHPLHLLRAVSLQCVLPHLTRVQPERSVRTGASAFSTAHQHAERGTSTQQGTAIESQSLREGRWGQHVQTRPRTLCMSWISTGEVCVPPCLPSSSQACSEARVRPLPRRWPASQQRAAWMLFHMQEERVQATG